MPEEIVARASIRSAPLSTQAVASNFLELLVRSKICASEIQSFLLLRHFNCLVYDRTGEGKL